MHSWEKLVTSGRIPIDACWCYETELELLLDFSLEVS
jgi:hypothetical protein